MRAIGASATVAVDANQALAHMRNRETRIDLLFVDCVLGEEAARSLVQTAHESDIGRTILFFSPSERRAFGQRLVSSFDGWLVKPVRASSLAERVAEPLSARGTGVVRLAAPGAGLHRLAVLLAEDNKINALIARKSLETLGATVTHAADGLIALDLGSQAIRGERPGFDLILMDVSMPGLDGRDVTRRLRDLEARMGIGPTRIVATTAHAMHEEQLACRLAGMDDVLTKPIDPARFRQLLGEPETLRHAG